MPGTAITAHEGDHLEDADSLSARCDRLHRLRLLPAGATILHPTADAIPDSRAGARRECAEAVTIEPVVTVRRAEADDADSVLELMEELGRPSVGADASTQREVFLAHLGGDDAAVFVAESDGKIIGAASFWVRPRLN